MFRLSRDSVLSFVRKSIDELQENGSSMLNFDTDDIGIDKIASSSIQEAIFRTHSKAAPSRLKGKLADKDQYKLSLTDGVLTVSMQTETYRIVSFRAPDSPIVLKELLEEYSTEGRMQTNPYTRGTWDAPKLVLMEGKGEAFMPVMKYYSMKEGTKEVPESVDIEYIPKPEGNAVKYEIAPDLLYAVLNMTVSIVLTSYSSLELAARFEKKAEEYMI